MKEIWDNRYSGDDYAYGLTPNVFFKEQLQLLTPGSLLLPCEGEGRNAVHAAAQGWAVSAFDFSRVAKEKALKLAESKQVRISYTVSAVADYPFPTNYFDAAAIIFGHFAPDERAPFHHKMMESLKPGGKLIMQVYDKKQLVQKTGGPPTETLLYTEVMLRNDFAAYQIEHLVQRQTIIQEGELHNGLSEVLDVIVRK